MKRILLFLAVLIAFHSTAQDRAFYGKVIDKDNKKRIPFAVIQAKDRNEGVYCDEHGIFSITSNTDSVKAFIISCLGYKKQEIPVSQFPKDSITIALQREYSTLKTVEFKSRKGKMKDGILGRRNMKHIGDCYQKYGEEDAVYFKSDPGRDGTLQEILVYITSEGVPDTKFRIHVYEKDPLTNLPSKELTDSNLIVHATTGDEWVVADLGSKNIPIRDGIYVSVEWISGHGNNAQNLQSGKHKEVNEHNGQVLGLALNYGVPHMYFRQAFHSEWGNRTGHSYSDYLCPMIYCTYSYVKAKKKR
jgi:hypothetical protein